MSESKEEAYRTLRKLKRLKRETKNVPGKEKTYRKAKKAIRVIEEQFGL